MKTNKQESKRGKREEVLAWVAGRSELMERLEALKRICENADRANDLLAQAEASMIREVDGLGRETVRAWQERRGEQETAARLSAGGARLHSKKNCA
jgi:hypothetical protein